MQLTSTTTYQELPMLSATMLRTILYDTYIEDQVPEMDSNHKII